MSSQEKMHPLDEDRLSMISRMSQNVGSITKANLTEVKAFNNPPQLVKEVLHASFTVLGDTNIDWNHIRKAMGDLKFIKRIQDLDPESVPADRRRKARQILGDASKEKVKAVNVAMVPIFEWCEAVAED